MAGPAKRMKTFVTTIHSMGLLPVKQTAPVAAPQLQAEPDSVHATGYGNFTEQQRLPSVSSTPVASRLTMSVALERPSTAERHTAIPASALQHVHDHQVAAHTHTHTHIPYAHVCFCVCYHSLALVRAGPAALLTTAAPRLHALGIGIMYAPYVVTL